MIMMPVLTVVLNETSQLTDMMQEAEKGNFGPTADSIENLTKSVTPDTPEEAMRDTWLDILLQYFEQLT